MDVLENGPTSLKKAIKHWNTLLTSLFDHLYEKTKFKKLNNRRRLGCGCMGFVYVGSWLSNNLQ